MKKSITIITVLITLAFYMTSCNTKKGESAATSEAEEAAKATEGSHTYTADIERSKLRWLGTKVTGQHDGTINFKEGHIDIEEGRVVSGTFVFDMNSIVVLDLTDEVLNNKLVNHLKHNDFFAVDSFPHSTFEITAAEYLETPSNGNNYTISGNMTIRGVSKNISFPALVEINDNIIMAKGKVTLDRTEWNVKYGSGKFFKGLGDQMINDNFEIGIELIATKE